MKRLLSGNEAVALGAHHAGVLFATAYPGTPSTEILEAISRFSDVYTEWSTNEKVAFEVGMGASYTGVRTMVSMKQVGLNVAADPFMAAATTGICGGLVVVCADDPGIHSSQGEQDNRHFARLAKVPMLEPSDSQEAYDFMAEGFDISEKLDTPVLLRTTTRISHSKSVVDASRERMVLDVKPSFPRNARKYVMLPTNARVRKVAVEERLDGLKIFVESFKANRLEMKDRKVGIIASGIAYQYAREVLPEASFLKLGMTYPLPEKLIHQFAGQVERILVVEELDPFLEENIRAMGIEVSGKQFVPRTGELNVSIVAEAFIKAGLPAKHSFPVPVKLRKELPGRPPLLCPGCPHSGAFYILASMGQRLVLPGKTPRESTLAITGDIGCYTLGAYPPLNAMDTTGCMGASIGQAIGMEKAGLANKVVAVIGDSTFLHSGITGLVDGVYNQSKITVVILDNSTTAMTGHQEHPGTGISAQGQQVGKVILEDLIRGIGINDVKVVNAFDIKEIRSAIKDSLEKDELSVVIARGACAVKVPSRREIRKIEATKCNQCGICLLIGCPAIQTNDKHLYIEPSLCMGAACTICEQICPQDAIGPVTAKTEAGR